MAIERDFGREAQDAIATLWQVDEDRVVRTENGFDWWPSQFRVSAWTSKADVAEHGEAW